MLKTLDQSLQSTSCYAIRQGTRSKVFAYLSAKRKNANVVSSSRFFTKFAPMVFLLGFTFVLYGCQTTGPRFDTSTSLRCRNLVSDHDKKTSLEVLNGISGLYHSECWNEVIFYGNWLRNNFRDKTYSVSSELASVILPEDQVLPYNLESYERSYLNILLALSYFKLDLKEEGMVELRRARDEQRAFIYNFGDDPVTSTLLAIIYENLGDLSSARPYWQRALDFYPSDGPEHLFFQQRIADIDQDHQSTQHWRIFEFGELPDAKWKMQVHKTENSYYKIFPGSDFPPNCHDGESLFVNSQPWFEKIQKRYSQSYHPYLNYKSWLRLPVGIAFGAGTATTGLGIAVGGCAADFAARAKGYSGDDILCRFSLKVGGELMSKSTDVFSTFAGPDLRHWQSLPIGFWISREGAETNSKCRPNTVLYEGLKSIM